MTRQESIKQKKDKLETLSKIVALLPTKLSKAQKGEAENIQIKEQFNLNELLEECQDRELDIKIQAFERLIQLMKQ